MKFYRYPLAIVAFALIGIFLLVWAWHLLGGKPMETYWYYFPAGAAFYLLVSFVLSKVNLHWEIDVLLQVALVLAPVLWYVNQRDGYKRPVYIFIVKSGYNGPLTVHFDHSKGAISNVHSIADTLYFKFDDNGEILLNEEVEYVKQSMHRQLFYLHPDGSKKRIIATKDTLQSPIPAGGGVLTDDSVHSEKGRMDEMYYSVKAR